MKTFEERIKLCNEVYEGCEIEDAIKLITEAARILHAFEDYDCQILLITAERLCKKFVQDVLVQIDCDYDEYLELCSEEAYSYFTGGARKLTKEEFEKYESMKA